MLLFLLGLYLGGVLCMALVGLACDPLAKLSVMRHALDGLLWPVNLWMVAYGRDDEADLQSRDY